MLELPSQDGCRAEPDNIEIHRNENAGDPLACPNCSAEVKVVAFILDPPAIRKILDHLRGLAHGTPRPTAASAAN